MRQTSIISNLGVALCLCLTIVAPTGCRKQKAAGPDAEAMGRLWVSKARMCMAQGQWEQARIMIDSLRTHTPTALNAREDGIIVLDSIELLSARQSADSLQSSPLLKSADMIVRDSISTQLDRAEAKVRFYEKKIAYDLQHKQQH